MVSRQQHNLNLYLINQKMEILVIRKGEIEFTITATGGNTFTAKVNNGEIVESLLKDKLSCSLKGDVLEFGVHSHYKSPDGKKVNGLSLTPEQISWFKAQTKESVRLRKVEENDRESNRPCGYPDYDNIVIYSVGCDTGSIYSKENSDAIELAIKNNAIVTPVLRGERDETNKYPGQMDGHIPVSYAQVVDGKFTAKGYKYVYAEWYSITQIDYKKALLVIQKKQEKSELEARKPFEEARITGNPVLISKIVVPESETPLVNDGEDDMVDVCTYAMPDGSTEIKYFHNY